MGKTVTSRFVLKGDNQLNSAFSKAQGQLGRLNKQVQKFGMIAKAAIGFAVVAAMKKSVTASREFERAMAEVSTLLDDTSSVDALAQSINDLSVQFGQAPTEQAAALYQIISAGASDSATQIVQLNAANKLALGGVTDLATAADGLTSVLNAYAGTGLNAQRVSDIMFETMRRGKTTIGELSQNIGNVATISSQVGVTFEELGAAIATVTVSGINTSKAVDGLRGVLSAALKQSDQTRKAAAELGIEFDANRFKAVGLLGVLRDIADSGATESQLSRLVGRVEGLTNILALAKNNGAKFKENLETITGSLGATDIAVAKLADTADQKFKQLGAAVTVEMTKAGDSIKEALLPAATFITENLGDALSILGREFKITLNLGIIAFEGLKVAIFGLADAIINGPNRAVNLLLEQFNRIPGVDIDFKFGALAPSLQLDLEQSKFIIESAMAEIAAILATPLPSTGVENRLEAIRNLVETGVGKTNPFLPPPGGVKGDADEIARILATLMDQVSTFGLNDQDKALFKLIDAGATEEQIALVRLVGDELRFLEEGAEAAKLSAENRNALEREYAQLIGSTRTAAEAHSAQITRIDELYIDGIIPSAEAYADILERTNKKFAESQQKLDQFTIQAARNLQSAFADFLFDPFDEGLKGMLKGFAQTVQRMVAEALAAQILKSLFGDPAAGGGLSGILSNIFGGGRAHGGPISAGIPYLVGERGPELIIPRNSGNVIPNNRLAGPAGNQSTYITVNLPPSRQRRSAQQTANEVSRIQSRASSRNR